MSDELLKAWGGRIAAVCLALSMGLGSSAHAQTAGRDAPWAGRLFVGSNYQSVDRTREQVVRDIARMKGAGFKVVRMGDLSWDYFEPADGRFEFAVFDWIMDQMQ